MQCGDQISRISFDFLKWRSMGPQKLATIIGHKYSIFKPSKKNKGIFLIIKIRQIIRSKFFSKISIFWNFKNCVYISWKIKILTILRHKITQIFTKKYYLISKFSKLHNSETHFCELQRPHAPPFQKVKWNPWNLVTTLQKSCFLGPTIFKFPEPNWRYNVHIFQDRSSRGHFSWGLVVKK